MNKQTFKFNVGDKVLNRHGLEVTVIERKQDKQFGHNIYRLDKDVLRIWHTEGSLKPVN